MKKLFIILVYITLLGCDVQKEEDGYTAIGTYKLVEAVKYVQTQYSSGSPIDLYNLCSRNSTITINRNGTFEIKEFMENGEECVEILQPGTWAYKEIVYNNALGKFKVNNSDRVYEVFSKEINSDFTVNKIDVTYGSTLDTPSGRWIYTYRRIN